MNHLINWHSESSERWESCLRRAIWHKANRSNSDVATGSSIGLVFFNPSLRTRASMELAASELGANFSTLNMSGGLWGIAWDDKDMDSDAAEHIEEAIGVLSRYYSALGVRVFAAKEDYQEDTSDKRMNQIVQASSVPIVNLESAMFHPCQALADATTLIRNFDVGDGNLKLGNGRKFVLQWCYHPKALPMAVPNSTLLMAARLGFDVTLSHPPGFDLDDSITTVAEKTASDAGGSLTVSNEISSSANDAQIVYAKAWGGRRLYSEPIAEQDDRDSFKSWKVSREYMSQTNDAGFMHCLPVRRGVVVDAQVLKSDSSLHLEQAENRLHAQKAILESVWGL